MQRIRITRSRNRPTYTLVICPTCRQQVRQFSDGRLSKHYLLDNDLCPGPHLKTRTIRKQIREFLGSVETKKEDPNQRPEPTPHTEF